MKKLYLVTEGVVTEADENTPFDGISSVLCLAETPDKAHWLAANYDADLITYDNVNYNGKTISVLYRQEE